MKKKRALDLTSVVGDLQNDDGCWHVMEVPTEEEAATLPTLPVATATSESRLIRRTAGTKRLGKSCSPSNQELKARTTTTTTTTSSAEDSDSSLSPQCVSDDEQGVEHESSSKQQRRLEKKRKIDSSFVFEPISCNRELVDPEFDVWFASSFHILILSHMVACVPQGKSNHNDDNSDDDHKNTGPCCARCRLCPSVNHQNTFYCPNVEALQAQLPAMANHLMQCSHCPPWLRRELVLTSRQAQQQPASAAASLRLRDEYAQCVWERLQAHVVVSTSSHQQQQQRQEQR